jgi:hypothetical protein
VSEYHPVPCSFSLKSILKLNSKIPQSGGPEVALHRREFRSLAFTSLLLAALSKLFGSNLVREAAEKMYWNAVGCAENAMDIVPINAANDSRSMQLVAWGVTHG